MARPRPLAHKAPALIFAFFLALLFSAPTLAATDSLDLTFSVTSAAPPVFSSEKLAAGVLTTGVNEVALSLSNPSAGNEYAETEVELVLAGVPDQGVARLERKTGDDWALVDPVETPAGLSYALAATGPLAPGGGLTLELRLTLSGEFRGTTPALTAQVYQVSGGTKLLIAGAEKTFALAVQGPETALGPTVPEGNPPVFGVAQSLAVDLTARNATAAGYEGVHLKLILSGVPAAVALSGSEALVISQESGGTWQPVSLTRAENGDISADLGPEAGFNLAPGAEVTVPLKISWPADSAGTYTWSTTLEQNQEAGGQWTLAHDVLGSFQVVQSNPTVSLSVDNPDFGVVPCGTWSSPVRLTITNTGNVPESYLIKGTNTAGSLYRLGADFYVDAIYQSNQGAERELLLNTGIQPMSGLTVQPGASVSVTLKLKPQAVTMAPGTYQFTVTVEAQPAAVQ